MLSKDQEAADARGAAMISDQRFYARRAAEELSRAARAMTPEAKTWHLKLALDFESRARGERQLFLVSQGEEAELLMEG